MEQKTYGVRDIATMCRVSTATVSRALNNGKGVGSATRKRILEVARSVNYRPYANCSQLEEREEPCIAVIVAPEPWHAMANPFYAEAIAAAMKVMAEGRGSVQLPQHEAISELAELPLALSALSGVQGVLFLFRNPRDSQLTGLHEARLPYVIVGGELTTPYPRVGLDERVGSAVAARHLIELGHERIGYWGWDMRVAIEGLFLALQEANLRPPAEWIVTPRAKHTGRNWDEVFDWGRLDAPDLPTAFFCNNDLVAAQLVNRLQDRGISVPSDVSVIGFSDLPIAVETRPSLSTVRMPIAEMASRGTECLLEIIRSERTTVREMYDSELIVRDSTAPPRETS